MERRRKGVKFSTQRPVVRKKTQLFESSSPLFLFGGPQDATVMIAIVKTTKMNLLKGVLNHFC